MDNKDADSGNDYGAVIDHALQQANGGIPSALFEEVTLEALRELRKANQNAYWRIEADMQAAQIVPYRQICRLTNLTDPIAKDKGKAPGNAEHLIELVQSKAELFHDEDEEYYATCPVENPSGDGTHKETFLLRGKDFRSWASRLFFAIHGTTPGDSAFKDALDTLEGFAAEGAEQAVYLRYAWLDSSVYVALHDELARVVLISAEGWRVLASNECDVRFRKSRNRRPLPVPVAGELSQLWEHINPVDDATRCLVEAWLLESMRSEFPYPVMEVSGEQGSAKSTFQGRIGSLIDPAKVMLRREPKEIPDYFVAARHNHLLIYDNMSNLTAGEQDALCTMSTGGGFATRRLHTTSEEEMWEAKRPVIIGGISELATQADLADRVVSVELPIIKTYKQLKGLEDAWAKDYPAILGGLYTRMAQTLAALRSVEIEKPPRLADFAHLGQSMLNACGDGRDFGELFQSNRNRIVNRSIESSPIAGALLRLMDDFGVWEGTTGKLLGDLSRTYKPEFFDRKAWVRSPRGLGGALRRLAPALRVRNIFIEHSKSREGWMLKIEKREPEAVQKPAVTTV